LGIVPKWFFEISQSRLFVTSSEFLLWIAVEKARRGEPSILRVDRVRNSVSPPAGAELHFLLPLRFALFFDFFQLSEKVGASLLSTAIW